MFKFFTWAKAAGWLAAAAAFVAGPAGLTIAGIIHVSQGLLGGIGAILAGVSTVITTSKAGTATNAQGQAVNGDPALGGK